MPHDRSPMKIWELKRGDKFTVPRLPNIPVLTFDHMDGMYCYATTEDGQVYNLSGALGCEKVVLTDRLSTHAPN